MKKLALIAVVSAVVLSFSQCRKPVLPDYGGQKKTITFTTADQGGGRGHFDDINSMLRYFWSQEDGDRLYVYASADNTFADGRYCGFLKLDKVEVNENGSSVATFKGYLAMPYNSGTVRFIHYGKDVEVDSGSGVASVSFKNQNGMLTNGGGESVSSKVVAKYDAKYQSDGKYAGGNMEIQFAVAMFSFEGFNEDDLVMYDIMENGLNVSAKGEITGIPGTATILEKANSTKPYYVMLNNEESRGMHTVFGKSEYCRINYQFSKNKYYHGEDDGAIKLTAQPYSPVYSSVFTFNSGMEKVSFAKGNLQYKASPVTWRFAENQYDVIGDGNINISPTYDDWIDLFGWATSGRTPHNKPYETSGTDSEYNAYGDSNKDLNSDNGSADWGQNITDATWFTPSHEDLDYILNSRTVDFYHGETKYSDFRFSLNKIKVNDIDIVGLLIFPDVFRWTSDMGELPTKNGDVLGKTYDLNQFKAMEEAGAIFLPASGFRDVKSYSYGNQIGDYWTSSHFSSETAWHLQFGTSFNLQFVNTNGKHYGFPIRLVTKITGNNGGSGYFDDFISETW